MQSLVHEIRRAIDHGGAGVVDPDGARHRLSLLRAGRRQPSPQPPRHRSAPAAWLIGASTRVALHAGENIVGRGSDDVVEIEAPTISRHHARIVVGESVTIEDLASKNGTWLDGERLGRASRPGGRRQRAARIGALTFRLASQARPTESAAD